MKNRKHLTIFIIALLFINTLYLLRGFFSYPYPAGDGLARWLYVGKTIFYGRLQHVDDYPLLVPFVYSLFLHLKSFPSTLLAFFIPYLILAPLTFHHLRTHRLSHLKICLLSLPLFTLPLLEQMSGRGLVGFADLYLAVFIAGALIFAEHKNFLFCLIFTLLAAHTKNEGQVFALLIFIFYFRSSRLLYLLPLNLILWRAYLTTHHLTWFILSQKTSFTLSLLVSRLPTIITITLRSLFDPHRFSFLGPVLTLSLLSQTRPSRSQSLLLVLGAIYFLTFLFTPTSMNLSTHYAVAVDRLLLQLAVPFYLLTVTQIFNTMASCPTSRPSSSPS